MTGGARRDRRPGDVPRALAWVTCVLTIFNVMCWHHTCFAQATSENPREALPETIGPGEAARVFQRVESIVRRGEDPGATGVRTSAVGVTLRWRGARIGEGVSLGGEDMVRDATREALKGVARWVKGDAGEVDWKAGVSLEVEVAGAWTPREAPDWPTLGVFAKPGVRGVGARLGTGDEERTGVLMPSRQLRYGLGPMGVWRRVCADVGAPIGLLGDIVKATGVRLYTFEVRRVTQAQRDAPIRFPHRTGEVVELTGVTMHALRERARETSGFLASNRWDGHRALGMRGDLVLATGLHRPEVAPIREQMIAAYALARYARTSGVDAASSARARHAAVGVLEDAVVVEPGETLFTEDPIAGAGFLIAAAELRRSGALSEEIQETLGAVRALVYDFGASPEGSRVEAGVAAFVALALVRDARDLDGPERHLVAGSTVSRALLNDLGAEGAHEAMPWLGWALLESSSGAEEVAGGKGLRAFRDHAESLQASDLLLDYEDRDLLGGFLWSEDAGAYPDWRSARLLAALGSLLGDERLTPADERARRLDRVRRASRFVMQLAVGDDALWTLGGGSGAVGGVRRVVWGDEAGIDASAMALLALCETIDGVERAFGK